MTMPDTDALTRWASYPAPHAKRTLCPYCGRTFTAVCGEDNHLGCGRYLAAMLTPAREKTDA